MAALTQVDGPDAEFHIRKAVPNDLETIVCFNAAMAEETEDLELPMDTLRKGVLTVVEGRTAASYYVLEEGGKVVAQLMITLEWSDWRAADLWWIQSVYVRPDRRRRGYFRALYRHVRQEAQAAGASGLRLYAEMSNAKAHAAYEGLGMSSHYKVFEDLFTAY